VTPKVIPTLRSCAERLNRAANFIAADLEDDARDAIAYSVLELCEIYGADDRTVEAIRALLVDAEAKHIDYQRGHETGAIEVRRSS